MDPTTSTSRISAYFSFGVQWGAPPVAAPASQPAQGTDAASTTANQRASAGRVIDIKAQSVNPDPARRNNPAQPLSKKSSNIFLTQAPKATYAPPQSAGQPVRMVTAGQLLGEKLDTWG